jgi:serine/threonine protein kinase/Tol biopolymer transport system component
LPLPAPLRYIYFLMLSSGTRLGPYEILTAIGAGGMGEVYRARDSRLNRDVAVKVLPHSFAEDPERLRRFTLEAQSAGSLNHPNILAIYDLGTHDGMPYIVSELLEGETLRKRLSAGKLGAAKAIDFARQIASGLAAAHARGIVHRDIKPENLFVTRDGRVKILDFGLAKARQPREGGETQTAGHDTNPGAVLGTAAYMSPEQVRGETVDHRSDIFSFGCVLYEMLGSKIAFQRNSSVETMSAILKEHPPELAAEDGALPPAMDRLTQHCLEKNPDERFQSARDIAFDLETFSHLSQTGTAKAAAPSPRSWFKPALAAIAAIALLGLGYFTGTRGSAPRTLAFHRLTFRRGSIQGARFAPDGRTIVYSAAWENEPSRLFSVRTEAPESLLLGFDRAGLLGVSSKGELALALNAHQPTSFFYEGTLARAPFSGGAPRPLEDKIRFADWSPDGSELMTVRGAAAGDVLEYPEGKMIYRGPAGGYLSQPRISPAGYQVAFLEHPSQNSDGYVVVIDRAGRKKVLTGSYGGDANGLAWSANGKEVWFTAAKVGARDELRAVTLNGRERPLLSQVSYLILQDISRTGSVLLASVETRRKIFFRTEGDRAEREISWLDWTTLRDISPDAKRITFDESGEGAGDSTPFYIRDTNGAAAVRLGEGAFAMLSADGQSLLAIDVASDGIQVLPVGTGRPMHFALKAFVINRAHWSRDGKQIFFSASQPGHASRIYRLPLGGGAPQPLSPEGVTMTNTGVSPDGRYLPGIDAASGRTMLFPTAGGPGESIVGILPEELIANWTEDGTGVFVFKQGQTGPFPLKVYRLDMKTGSRKLQEEIAPGDQAGIALGALRITPDGKSYAYTADQGLAVLHVVDGLK